MKAGMPFCRACPRRAVFWNSIIIIFTAFNIRVVFRRFLLKECAFVFALFRVFIVIYVFTNQINDVRTEERGGIPHDVDKCDSLSSDLSGDEFCSILCPWVVRDVHSEPADNVERQRHVVIWNMDISGKLWNNLIEWVISKTKWVIK